MNIFLLSIIDNSIEGAMIRFSQLPINSSLLNNHHLETLGNSVKKIVDTYIGFFKSINIAPFQYQYNTNRIEKRFELTAINSRPLDGIDKKLLSIITFPIKKAVIPINFHLHQSTRIFLYTGIGAFESVSNTIVFFLYELSISDDLIRYTPTSLRYLDNILFEDDLSKFNSGRELANSFGKNYSKFQQDCREYFRDTFYQFHNKIKMMKVLEDVMLSDLSLKEIAYKNKFLDYNSMYRIFRTKYRFPIHCIPRLMIQI
ncbi:helix-turn-helix domain-containing protein [Chryseobacterium sp. G0201]|uniref:helix-turn-helix domain-containing protein n=1 Tax=Chryseobacterium sp. G0201 TaxID=2487065 RepID=UPI000F4FEF33|nr:helix-turn-helix domain-containing protein [Chryseobacterium sp. G0201]AZA54523.1 AraC family transcriptional regulator [Chryseobacterium sp. G0201]